MESGAQPATYPCSPVLPPAFSETDQQTPAGAFIEILIDQEEVRYCEVQCCALHEDFFGGWLSLLLPFPVQELSLAIRGVHFCYIAVQAGLLNLFMPGSKLRSYSPLLPAALSDSKPGVFNPHNDTLHPLFGFYDLYAPYA